MVDGEAALLAVLKALRLGLARERGVPAYVVFPDRTLIDMVHPPAAQRGGVRRGQRRRRGQAEAVRRAVPRRHRGRPGGHG